MSLDERRNIIENYSKMINVNISLRVSIKVYSDGNIDSNRYTYCLGRIRERNILEIMNFLTDNKKAKEYIQRRINDNSRFIISLDFCSVRFYLDSTFKKNRVSMISVEITDNEFKVRNYIPDFLRVRNIPSKFTSVIRYTDGKTYLTRNDGQTYLRFDKDVNIPISFYQNLCINSDFLEFVQQYERPVWFQFSQSSFTIYFKVY